MVERDTNNPTIRPTSGVPDLKAPTTGTTGEREDLEVIDVADIGKVMDAPDNDTGWSSGNPYDAPSYNSTRPS